MGAGSAKGGGLAPGSGTGERFHGRSSLPGLFMLEVLGGHIGPCIGNTPGGRDMPGGGILNIGGNPRPSGTPMGGIGGPPPGAMENMLHIIKSNGKILGIMFGGLSFCGFPKLALRLPLRTSDGSSGKGEFCRI